MQRNNKQLVLLFLASLLTQIARAQNAASPHRTQPDLVVALGNNTGSGTMTADEFKATKGINAVLGSPDLASDCSIIAYELTVMRPNEDPVTYQNKGETFDKTAQNLRDLAISNAVYYFDNIEASCTGGTEKRKLNAIVWKIK